MGPRLRNPMLGLGLLGLVAASAGCRIDQQDIETWKGTVKGPGKMVAVVLAPKYEMELRSAAALALVDMERSDVDGVAELQQALARLDAKTRAALIDGLAPGLIALMQGDGEPPKPGEPPPARQIRAKDSAFALIPEAAPETRQALTEAVVRWYTVDFAGRNLSGAYSAEQVMRGLGSEAAKLLVDALHARLPQRALVKLAELIGQLGDAQTKKRAADKLVKIEQEMRSAEFLEWLKGQIRDQFEASGEKPDDERVLKAAILNQAKFIDEGAIPAMKHLASEPQVADRLLAIAARKEAVLAARRTRALQALEGNAREEHLDTLLSLALDPEAPASVRDYAFDRVGDVRSKRAIEPMWPLVADADNQRLRWRAGELVLQIGGNAVLSEFFAKLPGGRETAYEPEELEGYASRMGQMTPPPTEVAAAQLASPDWFDRVIALNYFQRKGDEDDIPRMRRLLSDTAPVTGKGWDDDETVGKVAKQAIAGLRERLGHGKADAAGG